MNNSDEPFIVWVKQNEEGKRVRQLIPDAVGSRRSDKPEVKESRLLGLPVAEFRVLVTAMILPTVAGTTNTAESGFRIIRFSFGIAAIPTNQAFCTASRQQNEVHVYMVTTDTMECPGGFIRKQNNLTKCKRND